MPIQDITYDPYEVAEIVTGSLYAPYDIIYDRMDEEVIYSPEVITIYST